MDKIYELFPQVKYEICFADENVLAFGNFIPQIVNFSTCENVEKVAINVDNYYFLNFKTFTENENVNLTFKNKIVNINCGTNLKVIYDGKVILNVENLNVRYSHYEIIGGYLLVYFDGERKYFLCFKDELIFSSFYDEINVKANERYFMCKLFDTLNQGEVFHIKDTTENYLVYLDDKELKMQQEFCACVFLDCVLSGNLKYANNLLNDDLKQSDEKIIKTFFPEFDKFVLLNEDLFALKNKNTLAGIFKFNIENSKITNIIQL